MVHQMIRSPVLYCAMGIVLVVTAVCPAEVIYVKPDAPGTNDGSSWRNAYKGLQDALADGAVGDEIWVAAGSYRPAPSGGSRYATFQLLSGVSLYGGFEGTETDRDQRDPATNVTILSGDLKGDDGPDFANNGENSYHVVTGTGANSTALLDSFTITAGNANSNISDDAAGAGLFVDDGSPTITTCVFLANVSKFSGSAADLWSSNDTMIVSECTFLDNKGTSNGPAVYAISKVNLTDCEFRNNNGGGLICATYEGIFTRCRFIENFALYGGGVRVSGGSPTLIDCDFVANSATAYGGGGLYLSEADEFTAINCMFIGNTAIQEGGAVSNVGYCISNGQPTFVNCVFTGNSTEGSGGAMFNSSYYHAIEPHVFNCTFFGNSSGIFNEEVEVEIVNSILWNNGGTSEGFQISNYYDVDLTINHSCVQGWTGLLGGVGNFDSDPLFVDPDGADDLVGTEDDNLRLGLTSPCIDAGENDAVPEDSADIDSDDDTSEKIPFDGEGSPRLVDNVAIPDTGAGTPPLVDLGAYEAPSPTLYFLITGSSVIVPEGGTAGFLVALSADPGTVLTAQVAIESGDSDIAVFGGGVVTFDSTNFAVGQEVLLTAAEDVDFLNGSGTFAVTATGITSALVTATEADNDTVPAVVFVDGQAAGQGTGMNWGDAFQTFNDALAASVNREEIEEIWVAQGTYSPAPPGGSRLATFQLVSGTALYGGFAGTETRREQRDPTVNVTILSGDLDKDDGPDGENKDDNSFHVLTGSGTDATAVLDGFTITGGNADLEPHHIDGAGMYNEAGSPTIAGCQFTGNVAEWSYNVYGYGGGIYNTESSNPVLSDCIFVANNANLGGGMFNYESAPVVVHCTFEANVARYGAGIYNNDGALLHCSASLFNGNFGGGVDATESSAMVLVNVTFLGNTGGAVRCSGGDVLLTNCLLSGNTAATGAALYLYDSTALVTNSTLAGNYASEMGGGIYIKKLYEPSFLTVSNVILWGNSDPSGTGETAQLSGGEPIVNYSCIQGWSGTLGGVGNTGDDPLFADPDGSDDIAGTVDDDLRLTAASLSIDAGDNEAVPLDSFDLDGDMDEDEVLPFDLDGLSRFVDYSSAPDTGNSPDGSPIVDRGAYEYGSDCNHNGIADVLDVLKGLSLDCNANTVPDECEIPDCNTNGIPDDCDIAAGTSGECNGNGIPDECEIASGASADCNGNGIPDLCDLDGRTSYDCNSSTIPDECEIADGTLEDTNSNGIPDACETAVLLVNAAATGGNNGTTWENAYTSLTDALAHAKAGGGAVAEIWVAAGTYTPAPPNGDRSETFSLVDSVDVYGGFAGWETQREQRDPVRNLTLLSGDLNGNDGPKFENNEENGFHVVTLIGNTEPVVVDGFTVSGGNAQQYPDDDGGGFLIENAYLALANVIVTANTAYYGAGLDLYGGNITILDCLITGNNAYNNGGGINNGSILTLGTTTISGNTANYGAGIRHGGDLLTASDCTLSANVAGVSGGAIDGLYSSMLLNQCRFLNNVASQGGAVYDTGMAVGQYSNYVTCSFLGNSSYGTYSEGGAIHLYFVDPVMTNCLFSGNHAVGGSYGKGGALYGIYSSPQLITCTLVGNTADGLFNGGGIYNDTGGSPSVFNCILWNNTDGGSPTEESQIFGGFPDIRYSCIQGLNVWRGNGNIGTNPKFIDSNGADNIFGTVDDNARLSAGSPCIDSADNSAMPADLTDVDKDGDIREVIPLDLDDLPRFVNDPRTQDTGNGSPPLVDMGVYEFQVFGGCEGDANGDGIVDPLDAGYVLSRFGCSVGSGDSDCDAADPNGDGIVDPLDVGYVLSRFGTCS